jgi:vacuolar-type H+-ATPase subunit I/STV1
MVYFQTKNTSLGKFWRAFEWKTLVYFMTIGIILWPFGIIYGRLVWFVVIWYILPILVFWTKKNLATLHRSRLRNTRTEFESRQGV